MLLSALPLGMVDTAYAAALASGKCGDSATWTLDSTGTLTISGTGATYNYDMDDDGNSAAPWCTKARIQRVNKVVVNSGITELGYSMFSNCTQLTSVSLPSGLKRIGSCLFLGCIRLSAITIPSSVTTIESNAFTHCDSIAAITLPSGLRTMGDAVCNQMAKLTTATVSGGVTYLSNYAFNDCPSLKTITLPNTVKSIGICAFRYDTALKDVYFNGSVTQWTSIQIAGEGNSALYNADVHCTGLSAPTVTGGNDAQGRPTLKWNAVTGAAKYEVYRARSMDGDYIKYSTVTSTSYTNISYIENGNTYYYKVRALDANGTAGAWSSIVSVTYRAASTGTLSRPRRHRRQRCAGPSDPEMERRVRCGQVRGVPRPQPGRRLHQVFYRHRHQLHQHQLHRKRQYLLLQGARSEIRWHGRRVEQHRVRDLPRRLDRHTVRSHRHRRQRQSGPSYPEMERRFRRGQIRGVPRPQQGRRLHQVFHRHRHQLH